MNRLRVALFRAWMYGALAVMGLVLSPVLLLGQRPVVEAMRAWTRFTLLGLRLILGIRVEIRGREHIPHSGALIAAKHQSMLDTVAPFAILDSAAFVMKKELMRLPVFGWYCRAAGLIPVDRDAHARALIQLIGDARTAIAGQRQVFIFPEGTRREIGAAPDYKPGVAALYRDLAVPCTPVATNSGAHWPAHGAAFRPGLVVFEFLPPIPAGLKRPEFMRQLEERIETATARLVAEGV